MILADSTFAMIDTIEQTGAISPRIGEQAESAALVFVVDDQKVIAELTAAILQLEGFQTRIFHGPEEAWAAFSEGDSPDLLVTDYQMPTQNGLDLIEQCKERHPGLRTILYSGSARRGLYADRRIKPDGFLEKPFVPQHLIDTAKSVLAG